MLRRHVVITFILLILCSLIAFTGIAVAHAGNVVSANCTTVRGSFEGFELSDHPISFEVSVRGGTF